MHDSCVVVSLLKAIPIVLTAKILVISEVAKGLAPWASVWYGGECPHAYRLKSLTGGSYTVKPYLSQQQLSVCVSGGTATGKTCT